MPICKATVMLIIFYLTLMWEIGSSEGSPFLKNNASTRVSNLDNTTGNAVTHTTVTHANLTSDLPPLMCWKIPLYEKCTDDCHQNETVYRCAFRGVLPMLTIFVVIVLIPCCLWLFYRSLGSNIRQLQEKLVEIFADSQATGWKSLPASADKSMCVDDVSTQKM